MGSAVDGLQQSLTHPSSPTPLLSKLRADSVEVALRAVRCLLIECVRHAQRQPCGARCNARAAAGMWLCKQRQWSQQSISRTPHPTPWLSKQRADSVKVASRAIWCLVIEWRQLAIEAVRERVAAKAQAKAVADQVKRAAGEKDATVLTVDLLKEELRLRRARGEDIERMPKNRAEALEMIAAARRAAPNIPIAAAAAPDGVTYDASLVGRKALVTYPDEQGETQWYPALIVEYRPRARMYHYVIHFEQDGVEILVGLPDESVQLAEDSTTHCRCPRCLLASADGREL